MSRTKKAVIAASIMIVAGIITVISALVVNGFRWPNVTVNLAHMTSEPVNYVKKTVDIKEKFRAIDVKSASDVDVAVKKANGDTSYVEYYDSENLTHHVDISDGVLRITADDSRNAAFNISIGVYSGAWPSVTVYLAGTEYDDLKIVTSSGDVDMEYYLAIGNIDIEAASGDVIVNGANADALTVATSSGNIKLDSVSSKNTRISANSGDVSLGDVEMDNVISISPLLVSILHFPSAPSTEFGIFTSPLEVLVLYSNSISEPMPSDTSPLVVTTSIS